MVTLLNPLTSADSFSRTLSNTWGTTDTGQTWTTPNPSLFKTDGTSGIITSAASTVAYSSSTGAGLGTIRVDLPLNNIPPQTTDEILTKVKWSAATWNIPVTEFGPMLGYGMQYGAPTFYCVTLRNHFSELSLDIFAKGSRYVIVRQAVTIKKDVWYWIRFKRTADGIYAKIWADGTNEPASWTASTGLWKHGYPPTTGSPGFYKLSTKSTHEMHVSAFYYYTNEDTFLSTPIKDTFDDRFTTSSWGASSSKHFWEGSVVEDPRFSKNVAHTNAWVGNSGLGTQVGTLTWGTEDQTLGKAKVAFLGGPRQGDVEIVTKITTMNTVVNANNIGFGIRGELWNSGDNHPSVKNGYYAELQNNSNVITLYKVINGTRTSLGTGTIPAILGSAVEWNVKVRAVGSTITAKAWRNADSEPSWQVTATNAEISQGRMFLRMFGTSANQYTYVNSVEYGYPTDSPPTGNYVATTDITNPSRTDNTITFRANYTNDPNNNSAVSFEYRPNGMAAWLPYGGSVTVDRTSKYFQGVLTNLAAGRKYDIKATFTDADNVVGNNPLLATFETLSLGIEPKDVSITSVGTTTVGLAASYYRDTDLDSTATVDVRTSSAETFVVNDSFTAEMNETFLQNTDSTLGGTFVKHPAMTGTQNAAVYSSRIYAKTRTRDDKILYYHDQQTPNATYDVGAAFFMQYMDGILGIAARMSSTQQTYYAAYANSITSRWELVKVVSGVETVLASTPLIVDTSTIYNVRLIVRDDVKIVTLDGVQILSSTDNAITDRGYSGYVVLSLADGNKTNQNLLSSFTTSYRSSSGSWVGKGTMIPNRAAKMFTKLITELSEDTIYDIRVTMADADGLVGTNPLMITTQTTGKATRLVTLGASTTIDSANVMLIYNHDTNNNSKVVMQYKSTTDQIWTTINASSIKYDRTLKRFMTTLVNLRPSTTYEVKATVTDPDGFVEGSPSSLSGLFSTKEYSPNDIKELKQFVWKMYSPDDNYLGTLTNVPIPEFSMYENGGTTDLTFTLNADYSAFMSGRHKTIDFQNRLDIFVVSPLPFGPNRVDDPLVSLGAWTLGANASYSTDGGPDSGTALHIHATSTVEYETLSNPIEVRFVVPIVTTALARSVGANLKMYIRAYDSTNVPLASSPIAETHSTEWQKISVEWLPPPNTAYLRIIVRNGGISTSNISYFDMRVKEDLLYRGRIEAFTPAVDDDGTYVTVEVLGLASLLSDGYIDFMQFVAQQPVKDIEKQRPNNGPADPADIFKAIIDFAAASNPRFSLYYTTDSIKYTGSLVQYTFRNQQIRTALDKTRELCPPGWHYYIEPDGLVVLRGEETTDVHRLNIGREILKFDVDKSIRNLKNYIHVVGRQDTDETELDGEGSIDYVALDQASINKYGKRELFHRDTQIIDAKTAEIVGDGKLEELNKEEQRGNCYILDEKDYTYISGLNIGYNIEAFRPGDRVIVYDPLTGPRNSYWDQFNWDEENWDQTYGFSPIPIAVPIKTIKYRGQHVELELSERSPSSISDYAKMQKWINDKERGDE